MRVGKIEQLSSLPSVDANRKSVAKFSARLRSEREEELAAARREGVIEGLERALGLMAAWNPQGAIRAELERLKAEG